jgi:hypothetical protein
MIADYWKNIFYGVTGTITPIVGVVTSFQEQLEGGMRIVSLLIGIIVGLLSLAKLAKSP